VLLPVLVDYEASHLDALVRLWREAFEFGVGITDPNPLAAQGAADHNPYWEGRALFGLAQAELMLGRTADARKTIERFRAMSGNPDLVRSDDQVVNVNTLDALVALHAGDTVKGNTLLHRTLQKDGYLTGRRSGTQHSTLMLAARIALALHHPDSALTYVRDARQRATRDSLTETRSAKVGEARLVEALVQLQLGDTTAARLRKLPHLRDHPVAVLVGRVVFVELFRVLVPLHAEGKPRDLHVAQAREAQPVVSVEVGRVEEADAARQSLFDRRNTRPLVEDLVDLAEGRCASDGWLRRRAAFLAGLECAHLHEVP